MYAAELAALNGGCSSARTLSERRVSPRSPCSAYRRLLALDVAVDEIVDAQARRPRAAVVVVALEIHHVLALDDLAAFLEEEAVDLESVGRPGVEHDAIAILGVVEGEAGAAFNPALGIVLRGQGPTRE